MAGRSPTRSDDVNERPEVREGGEVVVDIRSSNCDGSKSATGREEFGILGEVSSLNRCQGTIHRSLMEISTNQHRWWGPQTQSAIQSVSPRFCEREKLNYVGDGHVHGIEGATSQAHSGNAGMSC